MNYRLLNIGEVTQPGDEYFQNDEWLPARPHESVMHSSKPRRRKIESKSNPPGYFSITIKRPDSSLLFAAESSSYIEVIRRVDETTITIKHA